MPHPVDLDRATETLRQLALLHREAQVRATRPPIIDASAWRGPAYAAYRLRAESVAVDLERLAARLAQAVALAREEVARALG
ncbi:MAG: hypothetical protein EAS51_11005 [Microbacteriaceae bacterium]|nr:MAG: hypothetical protein EAS51_11005 [Microbacteriaceae bacterium]